jgi:3-methyladenine DNA glycosylase AlkD
MDVDTIIKNLEALADPHNVAGMARYGISTAGCLGVPMPILRKMAREIGRSHETAEGLWQSGIHEARILAGLIDDPALVRDEQMEQWVRQIDSWDICDQLCGNLFCRTGLAVEKARSWSGRPEPFVKRAGFVLMAALAVHDKRADNALFASFLTLIAREAGDDRNFVKKAVNWALRQIGKRNRALNLLALETARKIRERDSRSARWIATDAIRELTDEKSWYRWQGTGCRELKAGTAAVPSARKKAS